MKPRRTDKLLLVYPPITKFERYSSAIGGSGGQQIPLGVFYLASSLRSNGFEAHVLDAEAMGASEQDIIERLQWGGYGVLGISTTTVAFHRTLELAQKVRAALPETIIVVGGPHVSSQPRHAMGYDVFDFAVRNEGEETLVELMKTITGGGSLEKIRGLVFRRGGTIIVNEARPYIQDINALPFPAYDLIPDFKHYAPPPCNYKRLPVANIITARGCPNQCTFCDNSTFGRKTRLRSAENIVEEIELLMTRYQVKEIALVDDTFTIRPERVYEIFNVARSKGLRFPWTCMARIDTADEKLLQFMKENGCWHISFGIESGSEQILRKINKRIQLQDVERVIDICHRLGILTKGFFIIGHPLETRETIERTIDFANRLKLSDVVVTLNTPFPGSYQFEHAGQYGALDDGPWSKFNCWNPVFVPHGLTKEILRAKHKEFYRRFYLRPRILWRYFVSFLGPGGLRRMISVLSAFRFLFDSTVRKVP